MKKIYLVIKEFEGDSGEKFTDIIHVCADAKLAVKYANEYVADCLKDATRKAHKYDIWIMHDKKYTKKELFGGNGCCFLGYMKDDAIVESHSIWIEEHELRED